MTNDDSTDDNSQGYRSVTLKNVAERAGVSPITVSRALNRPELVSPKRRARVEQAVRELGYVPNRMAGALASARTHVIPVIVPSLSNVVFIEVIQGIQEVLEHDGYQLMLGNTEYDLQREQTLVSALLGWTPAGTILAGLRHLDETRALLAGWGRPLVEIMEYGQDCIDMNVGLSHYRAGASMARHLIERGYRHIGFVGTQMTNDYRARQRCDGHLHALEEAGLATHHVFALAAPSTPALGGRALLAALQQAPELDAIFFANDDLAVGAILQAQRNAIPVPERIAIAGFNGLSLGELVTPQLTTIVSPRYRMGKMAATVLLRRISGLPVTPRMVDVGFSLAVREST